MLSKLLKYDFKNLYKTLLPIYLITLVITILTVILNNLSDTSNLFSTLNGLMVLSYVIILMVLLVGTFFLSIRDFYLDFASERGYLINTLPVKKSWIITSKFITSIVTMISSLVVMFISILILVIGNGEWSVFANGIANFFKDIPGDGILMGALLSHLGQAVGKLPGRIKIRETLGEIHRAILQGHPGHAADYRISKAGGTAG